jgi:hypothetical protein
MKRQLYTSKRFDFMESKYYDTPIIYFSCPACNNNNAWIGNWTIEELKKEPYFVCQKCLAKFKKNNKDLWDLID